MILKKMTIIITKQSDETYIKRTEISKLLNFQRLNKVVIDELI